MANRLQIEVEVDSSGALRGFKLVDEAIKKTSAATEKIADARFDKFADGVKNFIQNPLDSAGNAAQSLLGKLGPVGTVAAGVGAAIIGIGAAGLSAARDLGALGDEIGDTSVRMGLTVKEVGQFRFAMKYAGGDIASLEGTMRKLSQALDTGSSEGAKAREAFREIGISTRTSSGEMRPMSQILVDLSERLNSYTDTAKRNALATRILGRSAIEVLPDLLELSAGLKRAKELGVGPSSAEVDRWNKYQKEIAEVDAAWERLKRQMKEPLAGVVLVTMKWLTAGKENPLAQSGADAATEGFALNYDPRKPMGQQYLSGLYFNTTTQGFAANALAPKLQSALPAPGSAADVMRQVQAQAEASAASQRAMNQFLNRSLEGAQQQLERLRDKYTEARNSAEALAASGNVLPAAMQKARAEVESTRTAYQRQEDAVKNIQKLESTRIANLEKARDLIREGQGYYKIGSGLLETFVSSQDLAAANRARSLPSLFGRSGNPATIRAGMSAAEKALAEGIDIQTGVFVSPGAGRTEMAGAAEQRRAYGEGIIRRGQQADSEHLSRIKAESDFLSRIVELRAGPGGEIQAAIRAAEIRESALQQEYQLTGDIARYRESSLQNALDLQTRIAERERQGRDAYRQSVESGFQSLLSGGRGGLTSFVGSQLTGTATKIVGNIADMTYKSGRLSLPGTGTADNPTLLGKILAGTPFGADSSKVAIDLNTTVTRDNTMATVGLTRALSLSASSGGGGYLPGGGGGTFGALSGLLGGPGGTSGFAGPVAEWMPYSSGALGKAPNLYGIPGLHDRSVSIPGLPTTTLSAALGGAAMAGGGTAALISGLNRGGVSGALGIGAGAAGIVGGVLPLISKSLTAAGPWGMAIGAGLQLASMMFDVDPKKKRADELNAMLEGARYTAPESQSYSMDLSGRNFDYDYRGSARVVNNITNNVQAWDTKSFADFAQSNGEAFAATIDAQLMTHGPLQQRVRATALPI